MELCDDVKRLVYEHCPIHTRLVAKHDGALQLFHGARGDLNHNRIAAHRESADALHRVVLEQDLATLRYLCAVAEEDDVLCYHLMSMMSLSVEMDKRRSFALLFHFVAPRQLPNHPYGSQTASMWALLHAASKPRHPFACALVAHVPFTPSQLCIAYMMATKCGQQETANMLQLAHGTTFSAEMQAWAHGFRLPFSFVHEQAAPKHHLP